jgi:uncharacterized phage protein (TIGR02220 family)
MAKFRQVHTTFWQDDFVLDLTPEEKYFYLYLMTNQKTTQIGIYTLPVRVIEFESGYNRETVEKLIARFADYGKLLYNKPTKEIMLLHWMKYNYINSPSVIKCMEKELSEVKYRPFIEEFFSRLEHYGHPIDTVSIGYGEEEEEEEKKKRIYIVEQVISYLNEKATKNYKASTKRTKDLITARLNEEYSLEEFKKVIDNKVIDWKGDAKMDKFLRPETLFSNKFESYLNETPLLNNQSTKPRNSQFNEFSPDMD